MKNILFLIVAISLLASCSKKDADQPLHCYQCAITITKTYEGIPRPMVDVKQFDTCGVTDAGKSDIEKQNSVVTHTTVPSGAVWTNVAVCVCTQK